MSDKLKSLTSKSLTGNYAVEKVSLNFYTTSEMLQSILEKPLEKKTGRTFGPPAGKNMIYFIDDMNMPEVDKYGSVQSHTIIRQFMDYGYWYDRLKLTLKEVQNCQFMTCMNPTAGSFTIDPRLQRHFCTFALSEPSSDAILHIYDSILSQHIQDASNAFPSKLHLMATSISKAAIMLHQKMNQLFLPTGNNYRRFCPYFCLVYTLQ